MIEKIAEPKATDKITVLEGFDAMRVFLETIWQRQGKAPEDRICPWGIPMGGRLAR
jgi:hypothetical protein